MKTNLISSRRVVAALFSVGIALSGCAGVSTTPSQELQQRIEAASTRSDHEALATHYTREAGIARATAVEHRKMAKLYIGGRGVASMQAHCNSVVKSYESIAIEYDGMAASHRQMAEQAKP